MNSISIGSLPWSREEMIRLLPEFLDVYAERPIRDNRGGQLSVHLFYSWFVARMLRPEVIIESGVYKGQGTWVFEQASPESVIISLDPYLRNHQGYRSADVEYLETDFSRIDWTVLPDKENTLCFFDDHQDAPERVAQCHRAGFKRLMFEDNYPPGQGDCVSLKQCLENATDGTPPGPSGSAPLVDMLRIYHEFPPLFELERDRWNLPWAQYRSNPPLLDLTKKARYPTYFEDMPLYTWINYVELR